MMNLIAFSSSSGDKRE